MSIAKDIKTFIEFYLSLNKRFFTEISKFVWGSFGRDLPEFLKAVDKRLKDTLSDVEGDQWKSLLNTYKNAGMIDEKDVEKFYKLRKLAHPFDLVMYLSVAAKLFTNFIDVQTEANMNLQSQKINVDRRPSLPYHGEVINAAFIAPEKTGEVKDLMQRLGFTDEHINLLFLARYRLYPEETIKTLFLRGVLSNNEMFMRMREHGYTDTRIKEIAQSWEVIPGAQDLFWMVGKEAFEPDIIKMIGLDDEFPVDQVEWLRKQGISEAWAKKYWYAHWDQPSVQMGFEMLHRGVITDEELNVLFKAVEMPPFWRDKLTKVAYKPYTRVDVRRMHETGTLTNEDVLRSYKDLGYDDEKALNMTKFTLLYNKQNDKELTKGQIISSYKDDMIDRKDAKDLLVLLEYSDDQAEYMLYYEDYKKDRKYSESLIKNVGDKYKLNLIDHFEAEKRLGKLNLPATRITILMETWEIDRYEDTKLPSKTDLDKFYRNKIINQDTYYNEMKRLGYSTRAVDWYVSLVKIKKAG